jgi:hypothetical protein|eukprot:COSAG01_NODE_3291_length_6306_cov_2.411632_4_plen_39_part_00
MLLVSHTDAKRLQYVQRLLTHAEWLLQRLRECGDQQPR